VKTSFYSVIIDGNLDLHNIKLKVYDIMVITTTVMLCTRHV